MDGRLLQLVLVASLTIGAVGCRTTKDPQMPDFSLPKPGEKLSFFGKSSQKFGPPKEEVVTRVAKSKAGKPFMPDTEAALADTKVEAAFGEGKTSVERDELLDSARQGYQRALKTDPKNTAALAGLAKLYSKAGDRDRASQIYQEAMRQNPKNHELAYLMSMHHAKCDDWRAACEGCKIAISIDPENRVYHKSLGYYEARADQFERAFETLRKVMPEPEARHFLGRVLIDLNRIPEGRQQLELAQSLDPNHAPSAEMLAELNGTQPVRSVPESPAPVQQVGYPR